MAAKTELRLTVPLRRGWLAEPRAKRANRAVRELKLAIAKNAGAAQVSLSPQLNAALWKRAKPAATITVLVSVTDGAATARLPDEAEALQKAKEAPAAAPVLKPETPKPEPAEAPTT